MITLQHPTTSNEHKFYLHAASYAYGGLTSIVLSNDPDPTGAWVFTVSDNADPEHEYCDSPPDHFFLDKMFLQTPIKDVLVDQHIIEKVPGGASLPDGRSTYRLCAGILPDTDQRGRWPRTGITTREIFALARTMIEQQERDALQKHRRH